VWHRHRRYPARPAPAPDGRRYLKAVPLFFISWINKAGTVNNNIVGMGRKTKNETEKRAIRFMLTSE
jgi:hypothetical protein